MKCPYCDREMQSGALTANCHANTGMLWVDGEKSMISQFLSTGKALTPAPIWGLHSVSGSYCPQCEKIILNAKIEES